MFVLKIKIQSTHSPKKLPGSSNKFTAGVLCLDDSSQSVLQTLAATKTILQNVAAVSSTHSPKKLPVSSNKFTAGVLCLDDSSQSIYPTTPSQ